MQKCVAGGGPFICATAVTAAMAGLLTPTAKTAVGQEPLVRVGVGVEVEADVDVDVDVEVEVEAEKRGMASSLLCKPNGRNVGGRGLGIGDLTEWE